MRAAIAAALLWLAVGAASPAGAVESPTDHWEKTYPVARRAEVRVRTDDGNLRVHTWDRQAVAIRASTTGWRIGERGVRIQERRSGDRVEVEARTPFVSFAFGIVVRSLRIEVWVPAGADLTLETHDGDVRVPAVRGRLAVRTGDGAITVEGASGELHLRSGDGRVIGRSLDGTLDARTGDGAVRVDGRFDLLTLGSADGRITADALPGSRLAGSWTMTTGDGAVTLRVPPDLEADFEAHTGDGTIDVDLPVTITGRVGRRDLRGTLNGGGPLLRLRSGDGSIRLEAR